MLAKARTSFCRMKEKNRTDKVPELQVMIQIVSKSE